MLEVGIEWKMWMSISGYVQVYGILKSTQDHTGMWEGQASELALWYWME